MRSFLLFVLHLAEFWLFFLFLFVKTLYLSVIYIILQIIHNVNRKYESLRFAQTETPTFQRFNFSPLITQGKTVESLLIWCLLGLKRLYEPNSRIYVLYISSNQRCALRRTLPFRGETDRSETYSERSVENFVLKAALSALICQIPQAGSLPR